MLNSLQLNITDSTPQLIGHHIAELTFQTAEIPRFVRRALVDWDKGNIVGSVTGCILCPGGFQSSKVEFRTVEDDLLEVVVTFTGSFDSTENGEETELFGVRLSYSGIFHMQGEVDDAGKERCASVVKGLMKDALAQLMRLSGFTSQMFSNVWAS
jgi:hypothetical protein